MHMARMSDSEVPDLKPAMTGKERTCLEKYLATAQSYVEFGCGGSTLMAVRSPATRIWSVESDTAWLERIRRHPEIAAAEQAGRLTLCHVDIGPTKEFGYPATPWWRLYQPGHREHWPRYYESIWASPGAAEADLFLVDGRFRVACGLAVAAHCRDEAIVAVHDFTNRPDYQALLEVFDTVDSARGLMVLRRKPGTNASRIAELMGAFRFKAD
jgi:hypothetical protein